MKRNSIKILLIAGILSSGLISCDKNKILSPNYEVTSQQVYSTAAGYTQSMAKVYGAMALTGNQGPAGNGDIAGIDEGTSDYFRLLWYLQELPTDEAVIGWGDPGVPDLHQMSWSASNLIVAGLYYRSMYQITLANDFIRQSTPAMLASRGITGADATNIGYYRAEARFLRAYQYSVLMDLFANPPFVTDANAVGSVIPPQTTRAALYSYVVSELKAIDPLMAAPMKNQFGRADQGAVWALLSRVYLNAGVYNTGAADYTDAITYANKVIAAGYSLIPNYDNLFLADNQSNTSENIFLIEYNGNNIQGYGGTTFMTHAAVGGSMPASNFGISGGWAGIRTTSALVNLFPANTSNAFPNNGNPDTRAEFWTQGQSLAITDVTSFTQGYGVTKWRNVTKTGAGGTNINFSDVNEPIIRLSEVYLNYAEAVLRGGGGGDAATALNYVNKIRTRAYGSAAGNITTGQLTLPFILDERGRELYWEGFRRSDLIRFGEFTSGAYLWPFKGGVSGGTSVPDYRNLYPIPLQDLSINPNLKQNSGY